MPPVQTNPEPIAGPWLEGFVLDRHTISSVPTYYIGQHLQYDTMRSPLGELLYRLKYRGEQAGIADIVDTLVEFVDRSWRPVIECIVPAPPSVHRASQPVVTIAEELGRRLGVPVVTDAVAKVKGTLQMKDVTSSQERATMLAEAIQIGGGSVLGRRVLLLDDLIEHGSTLTKVATLLNEAGAREIRALVLTRTK